MGHLSNTTQSRCLGNVKCAIRGFLFRAAGTTEHEARRGAGGAMLRPVRCAISHSMAQSRMRAPGYRGGLADAGTRVGARIHARINGLHRAAASTVPLHVERTMTMRRDADLDLRTFALLCLGGVSGRSSPERTWTFHNLEDLRLGRHEVVDLGVSRQ